MSWRRVCFLEQGMLFAAGFLLLAPPVLAGDVFHAAKRPTAPSRPAPVPVVRAAPQPVVLVISLRTPARAAPEPVYVDLRGPDGSARRFVLEGARHVIQSPQLVLRPGDSLTLRWGPGEVTTCNDSRDRERPGFPTTEQPCLAEGCPSRETRPHTKGGNAGASLQRRIEGRSKCSNCQIQRSGENGHRCRSA
jgi:hypothetical protein